MTTEKRRFEVFFIHEYVQGNQIKKNWLKTGMGFENSDGSFNIRLNALPLTNPKSGVAELHMRLPKPVEDAQTHEVEPMSPEYRDEMSWGEDAF